MINKILSEIAQPGNIYSEIMDNMLYPNLELKNELISELAISFHKNKKKVVKSYEEGWFKYLFISAVKNQIHSKSSPFHLNVRQRISDKFGTYDFNLDMVEIEDVSTIGDKKIKEDMMQFIYLARENVKMTWFESEMVRLYYDENMTFRAIEKLYGIDHCVVFKTIKDFKKKMSEELTKNQYKIK
jgi:hypothetical protein